MILVELFYAKLLWRVRTIPLEQLESTLAVSRGQTC